MILSSPPSTLIINVQVDSLAVLYGAPAQECIWVVDSSAQTTGKGGAAVRSVATPGQRVRWTLTSVDLQAPAWLDKIAFVDHHHEPALRKLDQSEKVGKDEAPRPPARAVSWEGFVPPYAIPGVAYPYEIHVSFGNEVGSPFAISGCAIEVQQEAVPPMPGAPGSSWANQAFSMSGGVL